MTESVYIFEKDEMLRLMQEQEDTKTIKIEKGDYDEYTTQQEDDSQTGQNQCEEQAEQAMAQFLQEMLRKVDGDAAAAQEERGGSEEAKTE